MTPALRVAGAARTDRGCVRANNEDSILARPELGLWVVADGMGGHEHGAWASAAITEALAEVAPPQDFDDFLSSVAEAIHAANAHIFHEARSRGTQMGSTVAALVLRPPHFGVVWGGDSRVYLLRDSTIHRLTTDHTQVQALVEQGVLTPEEARDHPMGHVLTRAVGAQETLQLDALVDETVAGDLFLVCSDGLTGVVADGEIAAVLARRRPDEVATVLVELCLKRGAPDNVSVAAVEVNLSTLLVLGGGTGQ